MRARLLCWRRCLSDFVRHNPVCGALASTALALLARLRRGPLERLALLCRAARARSCRPRLLRLLPALEATAARVEVTRNGLAQICGSRRTDLPKGILLKPPVSPSEKGVIYLTFEDNWARLLQSGQVPAIARRYDMVLGPSFSPPPWPALVLMLRHWPGRIYSLLSNLKDAALLRPLSPRLIPVPLLASSWVDPDAFTPYLGAEKDYDLVMLANFAPFKRHWLLFDALRRLPRRFRVLLLGVPLDGRTEKDLLAEARAFGVAGRFDLVVRPSRAQVMSGLARARVSLVFSRREGSCIAVPESLFADTPVGLFRDARIGSKAFINDQTGRLLDYRGLAGQLKRFVEDAPSFSPRAWALAHASCHVSRGVLECVLRQAAQRDGRPWTRELLPMAKHLVPQYLTAEDEAEMLPWYEDFALRFGLLLGPATRPGLLRDRLAPAAA